MSEQDGSLDSGTEDSDETGTFGGTITGGTIEELNEIIDELESGEELAIDGETDLLSTIFGSNN